MRLLILRRDGANTDFVEWMRQNTRYRIQTLELSADRPPSVDDIGEEPDCVVHWINAPADRLHPRWYEFCGEVRARFPAARTVSPVWGHLSRGESLEAMREAGTSFRIPRTFGRSLVRENYGNGGRIIEINGIEQITVEFVDTRDGDGFYRKYRWIQVGSWGGPRHCVAAHHWNVHAHDRILSDYHIRIEQAYLSGGEDRAEFGRLLAALGYDSAAFDYSIAADGTRVIWEANAAYLMWTPLNEGPQQAYQRPAVEAIYRALSESYRGAGS